MYSSGAWNEADALVGALSANPRNITVPPSSCLRIDCTGSTGLYWCNDAASNMTAGSLYLQYGFQLITQLGCCAGSIAGGAEGGVSGEYGLYPSLTRLSIGLAYCHHSTDTRPEFYDSVYPGPWDACTGSIEQQDTDVNLTRRWEEEQALRRRFVLWDAPATVRG